MLKNIELFTGLKLSKQYDEVRRVTPKILSFSEGKGTNTNISLHAGVHREIQKRATCCACRFTLQQNEIQE